MKMCKFVHFYIENKLFSKFYNPMQKSFKGFMDIFDTFTT